LGKNNINWKSGDLIELEISLINEIRGLIEEILKFGADSGYNCKHLKYKDHVVNGVKSKASIAIDPGAKLKIAVFIQENSAVSRNTIHRLRHFVSRPETDSTGNGPKLLWTTSPAHYPHVAISRGH
jgi:Tfp pilus assembly protein PilO